MFGRYSMLEVFAYFCLAIFIVSCTIAFYTHASDCADTFFSIGFDSRKELQDYFATATITIILLLFCFCGVCSFLNTFNTYYLKGVYMGGGVHTLFKIFFLHPSDVTVIACLILVVLLIVLFLTLLFKIIPLHTLSSIRCSEQFNHWFFFITSLALSIGIIYIIFVIGVFLDPVQLITYLAYPTFSEFMDAVLTFALEQLVGDGLALIFVFNIVCILFIILFWILF